MPDDLIKYSDAIRDAEASGLNTSDVFAIAQEDAGSPTGYSSKATKFLAIANEVVKGINYSSDLQTTNKTVIGAINEVKSSAKENLSDLSDTTITTPSNADLLAYDSSTSKWVNTDLKGTASGSIATFSNGGDGIPCSVECSISCSQAGSGTPSPSNPRSISGISNLDISVADGDMVVQHTYTLALGETVYGGVARNDGTGDSTHKKVDLGSLTWNKTTISDYTLFYTNAISDKAQSFNFLCEIYKVVETWRGGLNNEEIGCWNTENAMNILCVRDDSKASLSESDFTTAASGKYVCYEMTTPTTLSFTGEKIPTLSGNNNIYHNGNGDIEVNYFTDKADNIAELIKAFL